MNEEERNRIVNIRRGALSGFAWMTTTKLIVQVFSWIGTIYVARLLSPSDYGLMAVAGIFINFATMIVDLGLQRGLIQKKTITRNEYDVVFYVGMSVSLLMYVCLFFLAPIVSKFYNMAEVAPIIQLTGIAVILASLQGVPRAKVMRTLDFRYRSIVEMISAFLSTITVLVLATVGYGVWSLVWGILVLQLISTIAYIPHYEYFPRFPSSFRTGSRVLIYGFKMAITDFMFYFHSEADVFIIGKVLGQQLVGFYSMAKQLASFPIEKLGTIFNNVGFPIFSRLQDDKEEKIRMFIEIHKNLLLLTMPLLIGLALVSQDLVTVLLTEKWLPIVPVLQALSIVGILRISGMLIPPVMNSQGKVGFSIKYSILSLIILPIAFLIGSKYGLEGVAVAWVLAYPIIYLYLIILLRKTLELPIKQFLKSSFPVYVASFFMAVFVSSAKYLLGDTEVVFRLGACVGIGGVVYLGVFRIVYPDKIKEIKAAVKQLRNKKI
jgi:O-antigen/teichoic acid export membrane protein